MSICHGMSGQENNVEQAYTLLDLAGQVSLRVGIPAPIRLLGHQLTTLRFQAGFRACYSHQDTQSSHNNLVFHRRRPVLLGPPRKRSL